METPTTQTRQTGTPWLHHPTFLPSRRCRPHPMRIPTRHCSPKHSTMRPAPSSIGSSRSRQALLSKTKSRPCRRGAAYKRSCRLALSGPRGYRLWLGNWWQLLNVMGKSCVSIEFEVKVTVWQASIAIGLVLFSKPIFSRRCWGRCCVQRARPRNGSSQLISRLLNGVSYSFIQYWYSFFGVSIIADYGVSEIPNMGDFYTVEG